MFVARGDDRFKCRMRKDINITALGSIQNNECTLVVCLVTSGLVLAQKRSPYTMASSGGIPLQAPQSSTGMKKRHRCADKEKDRRESAQSLDPPSLTSGIYLQALKRGA